MTLEFHEAAAIFPLMGGAEYEALKADIEVHGLREPIILYEGKILDGRNRYRACQELGKGMVVHQWDGQGSPVDYVISLNLHRRHLTESQRAWAAAKIKPQFEAEARERQATSTGGAQPQLVANLPQAEKKKDDGKAREKAAEKLKVSPRSVESAIQVQKRGVTELHEAVETGQVSIAAAAELSRLPSEKQKEVVALGPQSVKAAAKAIREKRKKSRQGKAQPKTSPVPTGNGNGNGEKTGLAKLWDDINLFLVSLPRRGGILGLLANKDQQVIQGSYMSLVDLRTTTDQSIRELEETYSWLVRV